MRSTNIARVCEREHYRRGVSFTHQHPRHRKTNRVFPNISGKADLVNEFVKDTILKISDDDIDVCFFSLRPRNNFEAAHNFFNENFDVFSNMNSFESVLSRVPLGTETT